MSEVRSLQEMCTLNFNIGMPPDNQIQCCGGYKLHGYCSFFLHDDGE